MGMKPPCWSEGTVSIIQFIYSSPQHEGDQSEVSQKGVREELRGRQAQRTLEWHTQTSKSIVSMNDVGNTSSAPNLCEVTFWASERQQQKDTKVLAGNEPMIELVIFF